MILTLTEKKTIDCLYFDVAKYKRSHVFLEKKDVMLNTCMSYIVIILRSNEDKEDANKDIIFF